MTKGTAKINVAMCIVGQFSRFQPWNFRQFTEDKFLFFEYGSLRFSTPSAIKGGHTKQSITETFNLTNVKTVQFFPSARFGRNVSSVWQYSNTVAWTSIQRMYSTIRVAGLYFRNYAANRDSSGGSYSHILRLREDVKVAHREWRRFVNGGLQCSIYVQECNSWGGVNLRWQLMKYEVAMQLMTQYLPELYRAPRTKNPERFEMRVMQDAGFSPCRLTQNMAFVVRYVNASFQCVRKLEQKCLFTPHFSSCGVW